VEPARAYIALGSNLGDRRAHIEDALAALATLPLTRLVARSELVETAPVSDIPQGPFLNAAAGVDTFLNPADLLRALLDIERSHQRDRTTGERWGPRTLDLDLLTYGPLRMHTPGLTLPHPRARAGLRPRAARPDRARPGHPRRRRHRPRPPVCARGPARSNPMTPARLAAAILILAPVAVLAQSQPPPPNPASVDVPVPLALEDLRHAYAVSAAADEVQIKVRTLTGPAERERPSERTDSFRIFTDPDPGQHALKRLRLELGPLTIHAADGRITALSSAATDKFFQTEYTGPLTPALLAQKLPPIPAPQLLFATSPDPEAPMSLPPYLAAVRWTTATARPTAKPPYVTIVGSAADRPVGMVINADSGRLLNFSAEWPRSEPRGSTTIELTIRPIDAGDPLKWAPDTTGRTRVASLDALRPPAPKPTPAEAPPATAPTADQPAAPPPQGP
jgi:2-amino-4-hydroxy-6-hydroxymethyldihydropteridine diphosphokinase